MTHVVVHEAAVGDGCEQLSASQPAVEHRPLKKRLARVGRNVGEDLFEVLQKVVDLAAG